MGDTKLITTFDPSVSIDSSGTMPPLTRTVNALVSAVIGDKGLSKGIVILKPSALTVEVPDCVGGITATMAPIREPVPDESRTDRGEVWLLKVFVPI